MEQGCRKSPCGRCSSFREERDCCSCTQRAPVSWGTPASLLFLPPRRLLPKFFTFLDISLHSAHKYNLPREPVIGHLIEDGLLQWPSPHVHFLPGAHASLGYCLCLPVVLSVSSTSLWVPGGRGLCLICCCTCKAYCKHWTTLWATNISWMKVF